MHEASLWPSDVEISALSILHSPEKFLPLFVDRYQDRFIWLTVDGDGRIVYSSRSVEQELGYAPSELTGRSIFEIIQGGGETDSSLDLAALRSKTTTSQSLCLVDAQGQNKSMCLHSAAVDEQGHFIGFVLLAVPESSPTNHGIEDEASVQRAVALAETLTPTERQVVDLVVDGYMNKTMAKMLGVAVRTIEARRARAASKLKVRSLPELVQTWMLVRRANRSGEPFQNGYAAAGRES